MQPSVPEVESVQMPGLGATSSVTDKLNALDERACDLRQVLPAARAVREQVDWPSRRPPPTTTSPSP